jgi:uncharacterized membrane protein
LPSRRVARLKPGVTLAQADADVARMIPLWLKAWPAPLGTDAQVLERARIAPALRLLKEDVVGDIDNALWMLMGTIGIVLLIACANVANLLLVRAEGRQHELAVRAALGAGWYRLARSLLFESLVFSLLVIAYTISQRTREIGIRLRWERRVRRCSGCSSAAD